MERKFSEREWRNGGRDEADLLMGPERFERFVEGLAVVVERFHVISTHSAGARTHQVYGRGATVRFLEKLDGLKPAPSAMPRAVNQHEVMLLLLHLQHLH